MLNVHVIHVAIIMYHMYIKHVCVFAVHTCIHTNSFEDFLSIVVTDIGAIHSMTISCVP